MKTTIVKSSNLSALAALVALSSPMALAEDNPNEASVKFLGRKDGIGTVVITGPDGKTKEIKFHFEDDEFPRAGIDFTDLLLDMYPNIEVSDRPRLLLKSQTIEGDVVKEERSEDSPQEQTDYFIGVACIPLSDTIKSQMQLTHGLDVQTVSEDYPADKGGIKPHDILLKANESELHELNDLIRAVADSGENSKPLNISLLRAGKEMAIEVEPVKRNLKLHPKQLFHRLHPGIVIPPADPHSREPQLPRDFLQPIPAPSFEWQPIDPKYLHELQEQMKELQDQLEELRDSVRKKSSRNEDSADEADPAAEEDPNIKAKPSVEADSQSKETVPPTGTESSIF